MDLRWFPSCNKCCSLVGVVDSREILHVFEGRLGGAGRKSLYLLLHFAVNLKLLSENKSYWKKTKTDLQAPSLNIPSEHIWVGA